MIAYNQLLETVSGIHVPGADALLPGASSQYDALYAKYNHSFSNGLSLLATYQWSKNMDDGSEALLGWTINDMWRDAYHPKLDYAISTHDVPQSFALAWTYQLPYGSGKKWGGDAPQVVKQTLGNWSHLRRSPSDERVSPCESSQFFLQPDWQLRIPWRWVAEHGPRSQPDSEKSLFQAVVQCGRFIGPGWRAVHPAISSEPMYPLPVPIR